MQETNYDTSSLFGTRKIIHIDMDSFFVSVEVRDDPSLSGKPVAVGGDVSSRGVISTANYIARKYGVKSAMPTAKAFVLCPKLILVNGSMSKYKAVSSSIREIMEEYTNLIEPISLDEAFLDVTNCDSCQNSATWIAEEIRSKIYKKEKLTASAGISSNKFIAKIASEWNKPNGQLVVTPDQISDFIYKLPVDKIWGVGPKTSEKLNNLGAPFCSELQKLSIDFLKSNFGKFGEKLYYLSRGIDHREVDPNRIRKSLSTETTFNIDLTNKQTCHKELYNLILDLDKRLRRYKEQEHHTNKTFNKIFIKIKFSDFKSTTVETSGYDLNKEKFCILLEEGLNRYKDKAVRLIGVGVRFSEDKSMQLELF